MTTFRRSFFFFNMRLILQYLHNFQPVEENIDYKITGNEFEDVIFPTKVWMNVEKLNPL